ncbi:initiation-specific alpha-1,6-mannosyltransferase [Colletotrichum tofieldiae]|uniref:Initiation-specific alpha-1,6-mannosyltransferase n=1 Tax=Colletotrichum tofieldiae TaxID=708197 RepID=A0A166RN99_9PEZI|nr:initiation-specific alpha-1,6-mannosyltransferase [Colletotrichum tofieldiae]GKT63427.1 initiation-specific alpha-1,6-mannosyltransferase [Colletotrichum tofieldiae]GKT72565.1 initiation-specific alpha-1,6-mannosyltransferase [Colletotrichum tofieldiae]GKT89603.1 initiation-specific alpha-1,6-mannosyltransferase [Colletotrichum tofieldiae]
MLPSAISNRSAIALLAGFVLVGLLINTVSHYGPHTNIFHQPPANHADSLSPQVLLSVPFPAKIWQSWKDDAQDPTERTVGFPHQWRVVNPGWRYERITDANNDAYVRENFNATIVDLFVSMKDHILKADFLRYLILLREGGVWADIDVYPHQPVSKWIPEEFLDSVNLVIGIENDHRKKPIWNGSPYSVQLCQYTVLAKPGHPAIQRLVDQVTHNLQGLFGSKLGNAPTTFEDVMATTGPFAFTKVMMDYFSQVTGEEHTGDELESLEAPRKIGDVLVLPKESFGWLAHEHTHKKGDPFILVEHLFIGSWRQGHPG